MSEKPPEKKGFIQEFAHFLQTFGIIGLAITFVIGSAASNLMTAVVADVVHHPPPPVGLAL